MARNKNTVEKRRKEIERKRKAEDKRDRRRLRREGHLEPEAGAVVEAPSPEVGPPPV